MVKTYSDMIDGTIDMARADDGGYQFLGALIFARDIGHLNRFNFSEVKRTIPYSNDEIQLLVNSLPDVIDDESCLSSESCAVSWMNDYNLLLDKLTERGAVLEVNIAP